MTALALYTILGLIAIVSGACAIMFVCLATADKIMTMEERHHFLRRMYYSLAYLVASMASISITHFIYQ